MREQRRPHEPAEGEELDQLLFVLGNATRLRILQRIATETHYPLQLAKELRISQQAVTKHLRILQEHDLVRVVDEPSELGGPRRKSYYPTQGFTVSVSVGPQLFQTRLAALPIEGEEGPDQGEAAERAAGVRDRDFRRILAIQSLKERIGQLRDFVVDIDDHVAQLDAQRDDLLSAKRQALAEASAIINTLYGDYHLRSLLYQLVATQRTVGELGGLLELRSHQVEQMLQQLRDDDLLPTLRQSTGGRATKAEARQ